MKYQDRTSTGYNVLSKTLSAKFALAILPVCVASFSTNLYAGIPTPENTTSLTYDANQFSISNASFWSADGPGLLSVDWSLSEKQWDSVFGRPARKRLGVGEVIEGCVLGVCAKAGAAAGLQVDAYVLPYLKADLQPGTFDAKVNYQPTVDYQFAGLGVDFFKLETDDGALGGNEFTVNAPSIKLETGLNINTDISLFAEACLLGCFLDETYEIASLDLKVPLLQIDTLNNEAKIFSPPTNIVEAASLLVELAKNPPQSIEDVIDVGLYEDVSALLGQAKGTALEAYKDELRNGSDSDKQRLKDIEDAESILASSPVSFDFTNPFQDNDEGQWSTGANPVGTANIGGDFLDLRLDVDQVIGSALGLPNGGSLSLDDLGLEDAPIDLEVTLLDIQVGPSIDLKTDLTLTPELMVTLDFSSPVLIKGEIGAQTSYTGLWNDIPEIALLASESNKNDVTINGLKTSATSTPTESKIEQVFSYGETVTATPTFFVESTLTNRTYIDIAAALEITGLGATIGIDGFAELNIGPLISFETETSSLAQVDVYNTSFRNTDWTSPDYDAQSLSFDSAGEVMFQARSVGDDAYDVAYTNGVLDNRIGQTMTVESLIANEIDSRMYEYKPSLGADVATEQLFQFEDQTVKNAIYDEYKIDSGQRAQVMTDGSLIVDNFKRLVIEVGGSLELAAEHPYGGNAGAAVGTDLGLANSSIIQVFGDIYMGVDSLNLDDAERYKFINDGVVVVYDGGRIKFDGKLENNGALVSYGQVELTGNNNESDGFIANSYNSEFDIFGNLELSGTANLSNEGQFTLQSGAEMSLNTSGTVASNGGQITNNGELVLKQNSELVIGSLTADSATLTNSHIVDNSGVIINSAGGTIVNGAAGHDWSGFRASTDMVSMLKDQRDVDIDSLASAYGAANLDVTNAVYAAAGDKQRFLSAMNSYMTTAEVRFDKPKPGTGDGWEGYKTIYESALSDRNAWQDVYNFAIENFGNTPTTQVYKGELDKAEGALAFRKRQFEQQIEFKTDEFQDSSREFRRAFDLRQTETAYGDSLRDLADKRSIAGQLFLSIERNLKTQADSGVGLIVNRDDGVLLNDGQLTNHSLLLNEAGAEFYNGVELNNGIDAVLDNDGGYIRNHGLFVNQKSSVLTNSGAIDNGLVDIRNAFGVLDMAKMVNIGTLNNEGELVNNDTMDNYGVLNNQSTDAGAATPVISNNGIMSNLGNVNNNGTINNQAAAEFNNHNKMVNNGTITNEGVFNNGQYGDLSAATLGSGASLFYYFKQQLRSADNDIRKLGEQVTDSRAREALVVLKKQPLLPTDTTNFALNFVNSIANGAINLNNFALQIAYNNSLAAAQADTNNLVTQQTNLINRRNGLSNALYSRAGVKVETFEDADGNIIQGSPYLDLTAISSVNTADLENNGTFINNGIFNNIGTVTNTEDAQIRNSGILMIGKEGVVDNAGILSIEKATVGSYEQFGLMISNGNIDNSGMLEISAGTLLNGTLEDHVATISNSGTIALSGDYEDANNTANLINQGVIQNQNGGLIRIGSDQALPEGMVLDTQNTFANVGDLINENGASIENYGTLVNAGLIDNQAGASFVSKGLLHNSESGEIQFAEDATLEGFIINNGLIEMSDDELLTLTGNISGSGTFAGNTLLKGEIDSDGLYTTSVNPGNSPGLLTFDGDVEANNVNWIMEIWGTERGITYDAIDIMGDLTLSAGISFTILSLVDFDTLTSQEFTYFSIAGDLFDSLGQMLTTSFEFFGFAPEMGDNWTGNWVANTGGGWSLNFAFVGTDLDLYDSLPTAQALARTIVNPTGVPEPETLMTFLFGVLLLSYRRYSVNKKFAQRSN